MWQPNKLSELDFLLADKWKKIAISLEIEVISPFEIASDDMTYKYALLIKHFGLEGATNGLLQRSHPLEFTPEQCGRIWDVAATNGYLPMNISQYAIENLNENEATTFLNYYKWFGSDDLRPKWHTWRDFES